MTEEEPEWDDGSRNWALALDELEQDLCPGCGDRLSVTLRQPGQPFPRWDVTPLVCSKCEATQGIQHQHSKAEQERTKKGGTPAGGLLWSAKRVFPDAVPRT